MAGRRKLLIALGAVVLLGGLIAVLSIAITRHARHQSKDEIEAAYLAQHVQGYFSAEWEETSSLVVQEMSHFTGQKEYRWSRLGSQFRWHHPGRDAAPPEWSAPVQISDTDKQALSDALNIAVRDGLWKRGEIAVSSEEEKVPDGTVMVYDFVLGPNTGTLRYTLYRGGPEDLRLFSHKIRIWTKSLDRHLADMTRSQTQPATP